MLIVHLPRRFRAASILALTSGLLPQVVGYQKADPIRPYGKAQPVIVAQVVLEAGVQTRGACFVGEVLE